MTFNLFVPVKSPTPCPSGVMRGRVTLSPDGRKNIERLFKSRRIKIDPSGILDEINEWLDDFNTLVYSATVDTGTNTRRVKQDISALMKVLNTLSADTVNYLILCYATTLKAPPRAEPNPYNLLPTLKRVCSVAEKNLRPRKGRQPDFLNAWFVSELLDVYRRHTGREPTSTPNGTFDTLLAYVLEDMGEAETETRRKLIRSALTLEQRLRVVDKTLKPFAAAQAREAKYWRRFGKAPAIPWSQLMRGALRGQRFMFLFDMGLMDALAPAGIASPPQDGQNKKHG